MTTAVTPHVVQDAGRRTAIVFGCTPRSHKLQVIPMTDGQLTTQLMTVAEFAEAGYQMLDYQVAQAAEKYLRHAGGIANAATRERLESLLKQENATVLSVNSNGGPKASEIIREVEHACQVLIPALFKLIDTSEDELKEEKAGLTQQLDELKEEKAGLTQQLDELEKERDELLNECEGLRAKVADLECQLEMLV